MAEYDERVLDHQKNNHCNFIVKLKDDAGLEDEVKNINTMPLHLGSFVLSNSKRIMKVFIHAIIFTPYGILKCLTCKTLLMITILYEGRCIGKLMDGRCQKLWKFLLFPKTFSFPNLPVTFIKRQSNVFFANGLLKLERCASSNATRVLVPEMMKNNFK